MEEILKFLENNATFFLATEEGDQPRVRPFGFAMEFEGKLYLCTGNQKLVYAQLQRNPKVEICAMAASGEWLRLSGKAVFCLLYTSMIIHVVCICKKARLCTIGAF